MPPVEEVRRAFGVKVRDGRGGGSCSSSSWSAISLCGGLKRCYQNIICLVGRGAG